MSDTANTFSFPDARATSQLLSVNDFSNVSPEKNITFNVRVIRDDLFYEVSVNAYVWAPQMSVQTSKTTFGNIQIDIYTS